MTNLINKEQLLTVVSVAVAFFLLGSMFIGGLIAMGKSKDKDEDLWNAISELQARVETLEEQTLPQGSITAPAYDSGWLPASSSWTTLEHGLGTTEVFIYLMKNYTEHGINQFRYGDPGFTWLRLTESEVTVAAGRYYSEPTIFRIMIWRILETPNWIRLMRSVKGDIEKVNIWEKAHAWGERKEHKYMCSTPSPIVNLHKESE